MWPFDFWRKRTWQRRYNAAVVVLLGAYMFKHMNAEQSSSVEMEVDKMLERGGVSRAAHYRDATWDTQATFRAIAMAKLGIEPVVPGLSWSDLMRPWRLAPVTLCNYFRTADPATAAAVKFLTAAGVTVSIGN